MQGLEPFKLQYIKKKACLFLMLVLDLLTSVADGSNTVDKDQWRRAVAVIEVLKPFGNPAAAAASRSC